MLKNLMLALALLCATPATAQTYPVPTGLVNDFADILPPDMEASLNGALLMFEEDTTVEIAVVTVPSLSGQTAEEYAIGIGDEWKVGKEGVNNGVVFLIAPNDREMYIRSAAGARDLLTAGEIEQINDRLMTRHRSEFRRGDYAPGISETTYDIMRAIDPAAAPTPPVETVIAPQNSVYRPGSDPIDMGQVYAFLGLFVGGLAILLIFGAVSDGIRKKREQKRQEEEVARLREQAIADGKRRVLTERDAAWAELKSARAMLAHDDVTEERKSALDGYDAKLEAFTAYTATSDVDWAEVGNRFEAIRTHVKNVEAGAREDIALAARAREEGPDLLARMPQILEEAERRISEDRDSDTARAQLATARDEYERARVAHSNGGGVNWLLIYLLLTSAHNNAAAAERSHQSYNAPPPPPPPPPYRSTGFGSMGNFGGGGSFGGGVGGGRSW